MFQGAKQFAHTPPKISQSLYNTLTEGAEFRKTMTFFMRQIFIKDIKSRKVSQDRVSQEEVRLNDLSRIHI